MSETRDFIFDSERKSETLNQILRAFNSMQGVWRVEMKRHRKRRTDRQNRYYFPCFVKTFGDFLRAQGDGYTDEDVHEMYKHKFLRQTMIDKRTGEVLGTYVRSTTDLSTVEFNEYLDKIAAWLSGFGIVIPEPGVYHEREECNETLEAA